MKFKKFFKSIFFIFLLAFIVWSPLFYFNVIIDPYGVFFKSDIKFSRTANKRHIKIKHLLKNSDKYDSFIFGSSRVNYFDPEKMKGGRFYNMTYSGGLPFEHLQDIRYLLYNGIKIKKVIIGIDFYSLLRNPVESDANLVRKKYPVSLKEKLSFYKTYLFNKPGIDFIRLVYKMKNSDKKSIIRKGIVIGKEDSLIHANIEKHKLKQIFNYPYTEPVKYINLNKNLKPIAELVALSEAQDFSLVFFINPVYQLTYLNINFQQYFLALKRLAEITDFYDFGGINAITNNSYYFYENSHYSTAASDLIIERLESPENIPRIEGFGNFVTKENIDQHISMLQNQLKIYFEKTNLYTKYKPAIHINSLDKSNKTVYESIEYINGIEPTDDTLIITSELIFVQGLSNTNQRDIFVRVDNKNFETFVADKPVNEEHQAGYKWHSIIPSSHVSIGMHQMSTVFVQNHTFIESEKYHLKITGIRLPNIETLEPVRTEANLYVDNAMFFPERIYVKKNVGNFLDYKGWATGPDFENPAAGIIARTVNSAFLSQFIFPTRELAEQYDNPALDHSGWGLKFPLSELTDGKHEIVFNVLNQSGDTVYQTNHQLRLNVGPELEKDYLTGKEKSCSGTRYHLDLINEIPVIPNSEKPVMIIEPIIRLSGWAVDKPAGKTASAVVVIIGNKQFLCEYGFQRKDVANFMQNNEFTNSGWSVAISSSFFQKGLHHIHLVIISNDGRRYFNAPDKYSIFI